MNRRIFLVAVLLLVLCLELVTSSRKTSPTYDETIYITAGYTYVKTGAIRLNQEAQPLCNYLFGMPLLLLNPVFPFQHPLCSAPYEGIHEFIFSQMFFYVSNPQKADTMLFAARTMTMAVSILLAILVFLWAQELYGFAAGCCALLLYVFCPNMLANSGLATQDVFVSFFIFLSVFAFWKNWERPSWLYIVLSGVSFGLAQASKLSALLLVPVFVCIGLAVQPGEQHGRSKYAAFMDIGKVFLVGLLAINIVYGFNGTLLSKQEVFTGIQGVSGIRSALLSCMEPVSLFLPTRFTQALVAQFSHVAGGHNAFLMGSLSTTGFWYYFLTAFLVKTPVPLLLLLTAIIFIKKFRYLAQQYFLLIPVLVIFIAASVFNNINVGLRYILPIYPFLFVMVSGIAAYEMKAYRWIKVAALCALGFWYAAGSLRIYPHYLAYFNEMSGGPDNGYNWLVDSNLDWGQDLPGLSEYVKKNKIQKIKLSYFGLADPAHYGIPFEYLPSLSYAPWTWQYNKNGQEPGRCDPANGIYAVSATNLQGVYLSDPDCFAWLKKYKPSAKIGYSIFIYDITDKGKP